MAIVKLEGAEGLFEKLDEPFSLDVPIKIDYKHEKDILKFYMKAPDKFIPHHLIYEEVFPNLSDQEHLDVSRTIGNYSYRGILIPTTAGIGVEYPEGSKMFHHGHRINPKVVPQLKKIFEAEQS